MRTSWPASSASWAIPEPIVPAPTMTKGRYSLEDQGVSGSGMNGGTRRASWRKISTSPFVSGGATFSPCASTRIPVPLGATTVYVAQLFGMLAIWK